ncbi:MAG: hypothetical protein [Circular genetic element sp.]|nr:MAG: hypothetical protein [Circular genetic element sp.]
MTKDNKNNNRTADTAEMKTNQYAYQYPTEKNDIVVVDDTGNTSTTTKIGDKDVDIDKLNVPKDTKSVLYRTDVDEYNTKYKTSDLQNHNTGSGLDITTYSAYSGFKEPNKEPEKVIVGVAGTDLSNSVDRHKMSIYV